MSEGFLLSLDCAGREARNKGGTTVTECLSVCARLLEGTMQTDSWRKRSFSEGNLPFNQTAAGGMMEGKASSLLLPCRTVSPYRIIL